MKKEKIKRCYYDCHVCGKRHKITVRWDKKNEEMMREFHDVDLEQEMKKILMEQCVRDFNERHLGETFYSEKVIVK